MLGTFLVLQGAQQTQLPPGGLKAAAGHPEDRVQLSRPRARHELRRDGESPALRGRRAGFVLNMQPGQGFSRLPSALPGTNEINTAKKRQVSIDGLQTQKQLNASIPADVTVLNQPRLCSVWPCFPPQWSRRSVCIRAALPG